MRIVYMLFALYATGTLAVGDYYYGVNLGFKDITVARVGSRDDVLPIMKIEGSKEYQIWMKRWSVYSQIKNKAWTNVFWESDEDHPADPEQFDIWYTSERPQETDAMFFATLARVTNASTQLGHPMNISAVTLPSNVYNDDVNRMGWECVKSPLAADIYGKAQVITSQEAVRTAYNLSLVGPNMHPCLSAGVWLEPRVAIFIDYGVDYLNLTAAEIDRYISVIDDVSQRLEWSESEDIRESEIDKAIYELFSKFSSYELKENLLGITLMGEASPEAMNGLRNKLGRIVPSEWQGLIRDQIDPAFVAAVGGAYKARRLLNQWVIPEDSSRYPIGLSDDSFRVMMVKDSICYDEL